MEYIIGITIFYISFLLILAFFLKGSKRREKAWEKTFETRNKTLVYNMEKDKKPGMAFLIKKLFGI